MSILLFSIDLRASCTFSSNQLKAQQALYRFELSSVSAYLTGPTDNPVNAYLLELSGCFSRLMGASSGKSITLDKTLSILEAAEHHPNRNLMRADVLVYAAIESLNKGESINGGKMIYQAWQVLNQQEKRYPSEPFNMKWKAVLGASAASVPSSYRWIGTQLGVSLNPDSAWVLLNTLHTLKISRGEQKMWSFESGVLAAFVERYLLNKPKRAFDNIQRVLLKSGNNPMNCFLFNSFALSTQNASKITPEHCLVHIPALPFIAYQLGLARLYRLSPDSDEYFRRFLLTNKGQHFIKSTLQKQSWNALIHHGSEAYEMFRLRVIKEGAKINDEDQQAYYEAINLLKPNIKLLRLRLLYDGGNFDEALEVVANMHHTDFEETTLKTEYLYRKGRILQANGKLDAAIRFYKACFALGNKLPEYYAVKSCLLLGAIEEQNGSCKEAKLMYQKALENKFVRAYRRSLEQEARSGIQRCTF